LVQGIIDAVIGEIRERERKNQRGTSPHLPLPKKGKEEKKIK